MQGTGLDLLRSSNDKQEFNCHFERSEKSILRFILAIFISMISKSIQRLGVAVQHFLSLLCRDPGKGAFDELP